MAQYPPAGEADGVVSALECTAAALTAAIAALEREASGDHLLGLGVDPDMILPHAAGCAPGASAGARPGAAVGARHSGGGVPASGRGAAGREAYASLESLEAAVAELAAGLGPADAERPLQRMESAPDAPDAAAAGLLQPDGPGLAELQAGSGTGIEGQCSALLNVLFAEAAGDMQGSGYLAELETLAESADWGASAAALDALVDELEALANAAGVPGGCALDSDFSQVGSPGWKPQWILEPAYSLPPSGARSIQMRRRCHEAACCADMPFRACHGMPFTDLSKNASSRLTLASPGTTRPWMRWS